MSTVFLQLDQVQKQDFIAFVQTKLNEKTANLYFFNNVLNQKRWSNLW
jgi:hypothetical protein